MASIADSATMVPLIRSTSRATFALARVRLHFVVFDDAGFTVRQMMRGRLPEPHTGAAAVLGDELDAGRFQRALEFCKRVWITSRLAGLKIGDCIAVNTRVCGKVTDTPIHQASGGSYLCACHMVPYVLIPHV